MNTPDTETGGLVSRRTVLKSVGTVGVGMTLAQAGLLEEAAAQSESIQDILNITATTEAFGVTFLGAAINSARNGGYRSKPIPAPVIAILEAARAQEQFHLEFFQRAGGRMLTQTFTLPDPRLLTSYNLFFSTLVAQEAAEIASQIAAMRTFTAQRRPDLVKASFQYAAEEAEHRVLANYALGARPANNLAFERPLFNTVREFLGYLRQRGIIGGRGPAVRYPGPGAINARNVIQRAPGGPAAACTTTRGTAGQAPATLPDTGDNDGVQELAQLLGLFGLGAAAMGAFLRRRSDQLDAQPDEA
jgi:hypothetical protein